MANAPQKMPAVGSPAFQTLVVNAVAKAPEKRTDLERAAVAEAMRLFSAPQPSSGPDTHRGHVALATARQEAADEACESYDFGYEVIDGSGWEYTVPGDEWVKPLYFRNEEDQDGPSVAGSFVVRFSPSTSEIAECYGIVNGEMVHNGPPPGRRF